MRDIVEYVTQTLSVVGVIVSFQAHPQGTLPNQYITFTEYHEEPELEAGDVEIETERLIQINIWSRSNYHELVKSVRSAMEGAGFQRILAFDVPYTDGDSHFNKVLRFKFVDET